MQGQIDLFTLLSLVVAVVAVFMLRSVLGRRSDEDEARVERRNRELEARNAASGGTAYSDKVVTLPRRDKSDSSAEGSAAPNAAELDARIKAMAGGNAGLEKGYAEVLKLDADFDPEHFVTGAKQAYEIIVTAFADGNRKALRDLLTKEVYEGFAQSISDRESRGERIDQTFVGIDKAEILEAEVKGGMANITVRFVSQLISAIRNRSGEVVSGDPAKVRMVTDIWTFSRDISSAAARRNPNWRLMATEEAH
ncbi:MAG: Tim44/TimA family putative adaptor protein [Hyphomicrobium sp.]|nr:Tim44/TimA family putative adaptor protein [Hyphomicrobium sp.]